MASTEKVHHTHISAQLAKLHMSLLDIVAVINRPQRDQVLIDEAGISLDRALFPLLVNIDRFGPIGVGDLADRVGRDYSTVSRQVAKLGELGLVERRSSAKDRRVNEAVITESGKAMNLAIDDAREKMARVKLETWDLAEFDELVRLMRKLADTLME